MIDEIQRATGYPLRPICRVLGVPRSSYYHAASPTATELSDRDIGDLIEAIFKRHRRRYGYRRIWRELADAGITCAPARVRRIMAERGLKAIQPKTCVPRTSDGRADKPSPNLLVGKALPDRPDRVWAGDITFVPTASGWLYLAVVIDLCTRRIVGWSLARHMRAGLVGDALKQALQTRRPAAGLIFHSDRGSQYGSGEYRALLDRVGAVQSMSGASQSLPQRLDGVLHGHAQGRDAPGRLLRQRARRPHRDLRLHRSLLQHAPQTLLPRLPKPGPIRGRFEHAQPTNKRSKNPLHLRQHGGEEPGGVRPAREARLEGDVGSAEIGEGPEEADQRQRPWREEVAAAFGEGGVFNQETGTDGEEGVGADEHPNPSQIHRCQAIGKRK